MERGYPRPQLERTWWLNLNGSWDFEFDDLNEGIKHKWYENHQYTKKINVPFPYQSKLSGVNELDIHDRIWYHRTFDLHLPQDKRFILHFGAVDYETKVYVNHRFVGTHIGGSSSFSFDITDYLVKGRIQDLTVAVFDPSLDPFISRGKQTWKEKPFECYYDRTSGIWQTVWLEYLDEAAIDQFKMTPNLDTSSVLFEIKTHSQAVKQIELNVSFDGKHVTKHQQAMEQNTTFSLDIPNAKVWSPENPNLYDVEIKVYSNGDLVDVAKSYFGIRKISIKGDQILLNNQPYYLRLVLDQGYYEDGLLSYPDEESLQKDIIIAKLMGFNGCRKHEKIEAERWMYYADKLGYLVSLEMPSQYEFKADDRFINEWTDAVKRDYNYTSLFMYVPFNESWGVKEIKDRIDQQEYVKSLYYLTKKMDQNRIVISNDGWEQPITEVCTIHTYRHGKVDDLAKQTEFHKSLTDLETLLSAIHTDGNKPIYVNEGKYHGEPIILSEFGGISYANQQQEGWGYTGVENKADLEKELDRIFKVVYESKHFAGFCYTQLYDVEQEINGFLTYDRKLKLPIDIIRKIILNQK